MATPAHYFKEQDSVLRPIIRPRGGGKTTTAVQMLEKDEGLCLFVATVQRQHRLEQDYPQLRGRVFTNATAIPSTVRGVVIDDLEDFLPSFRHRIVAFTITGEPGK